MTASRVSRPRSAARYYSPGLLLTGLTAAGARSAGLTERDGHLTIMVCETSEERGGRLGDAGAILAIDETAELKKGTATVGVARQYAGITGQVENCQTVVFAAYVTPRGHAPFDFRLYLPKSWFRGGARRERARVPART